MRTEMEMAGATVLAFWGVSLLLVVLPGADWAYAIRAGMSHRTVFPAVGGLLAGHLMMTLFVAAGVAALVGRSPVVLAALTVTGALYLMWLGVGAIRRPPHVPSEIDDGGAGSWARRLLGGFGVSGLNPKALLLFVALLPQFTDPAAPWPLAVQIGLLGLVHIVGCAVVYLAVATGSRFVLGARPAAARVVGRLSGLAMLGIGAALLAAQIVTA